MSETLKKIRKTWLQQRKNKNETLPDAPFLGMLFSECEMIGKNQKPPRDTKEDELMRKMKFFYDLEV